MQMADRLSRPCIAECSCSYFSSPASANSLELRSESVLAAEGCEYEIGASLRPKRRRDIFELGVLQTRPLEVAYSYNFQSTSAMQENPLNLSISFSGGQENNCDSLSNGE